MSLQQIKNRLHRLHQKNPVEVYQTITIDERDYNTPQAAAAAIEAAEMSRVPGQMVVVVSYWGNPNIES